MTDPVVSVCIPAYRRPRELREAVRSVLGQTFHEIEVVVGDDTGELEDAVREIGDGRVRYVRNRTRLGMAGNWGSTLDAARGRYRALLMDDDVLLPDFLEKTVGVLDGDPSVGVAFTNHYVQRGAVREPRSCPVRAGRHDAFLMTELLLRPVAVSAALMRAEVWAEARPLPDLYAADVVLYLRVAQKGWAFYYVDEPLMAYRVHAGQLSAQEERCRDDLVKMWELFKFSDPQCEAIRIRLLASALLGRAATHLKAGRTAEARRDATAARSLSRPRGAREAIVGTVARHERLRGPAVWSWRAMGRLRRG